MIQIRGAVLLLLAFLLLPEGFAFSQTVTGHVLESGSEKPIILAEMVLLDSLMAVVDRTFSNHDGSFILHAPHPGSFYVRASAMGYRTKMDGVVDLGEGGVLPVSFFLGPEPILMEGVEASVERRRNEEFLDLQGFYQRKAEGWGHFITPEEIERHQITDFQRLFQRSPLEVSGGIASTVLRVRGRCPLNSNPLVYVNGAQVDLRWDKPGSWDDPLKGGLEEVVSVFDILAVEVYSGPASTPLQWSGSRPTRSCGTVVIWTKGGR